jgi:hypothetical protein
VEQLGGLRAVSEGPLTSCSQLLPCLQLLGAQLPALRLLAVQLQQRR